MQYRVQPTRILDGLRKPNHGLLFPPALIILHMCLSLVQSILPCIATAGEREDERLHWTRNEVEQLWIEGYDILQLEPIYTKILYQSRERFGIGFQGQVCDPVSRLLVAVVDRLFSFSHVVVDVAE